VLKRLGALLIPALVIAATGCAASLPDPTSRGAQVLTERCSGCHRVYAPALLTADMWRYQVERMRGVFAQYGRPWLAPADEQALLDYLTKHAGGS